MGTYGVLNITGQRRGKTAVAQQMIDAAVARGLHVHEVDVDKLICVTGECDDE